MVLTSTHNLCFEQKYENARIFHLKVFIFFVVKFSTDLNRHVFVMLDKNSTCEYKLKSGIQKIFYFSTKKLFCGHSLEMTQQGTAKEYHNI